MAKEFDHTQYRWKKSIDYRKNPEAYFVGKGEQGVLICEPYLSEILPYWRFKTPEIALLSSQVIFSLFHDYLEQQDFVGADLARKFLQMGFTRSRRYANYKGGNKYKNEQGDTFIKGSGDPQKNESATIFYQKWQEAEDNLYYQSLKKAWKEKDKHKMKEEEAKKGQSVTWPASHGPVKGKVVKKITKDAIVEVGDHKKRKVKASAQDPQVVVKSDQTGKQAVHRLKAVKTNSTKKT